MKKFIIIGIILLFVVGIIGMIIVDKRDLNLRARTSADVWDDREGDAYLDGNATTTGHFYFGGEILMDDDAASTTELLLPSYFKDGNKKYNSVRETIITNFETGHGYATNGTGTLSADTSIYIRGTQSLKMITDGAGGECRAQKLNFSPSIDLTDKKLFAYIYVDDTDTTVSGRPDNLDKLWVMICSSTDCTADKYYWQIEDRYYVMVNGWNRVPLSLTKANSSGSPDITDIKSIRVVGDDKNNVAVNIYWGGLFYTENPKEAIISLTFDDSIDDQYTEAKSYMSKYGYSGTAYIITDNDRIGSSGYMTKDQLTEMKEAGWLIASHHSQIFTGIATSTIETYIRENKQWLIENGFEEGASHLAFPGGRINYHTVLPTIRKYYKSARRTSSLVETLPTADNHQLNAIRLDYSVATSTYETLIDNAIANKDWLIFYAHKIVESEDANTTNEIEIKKFQHIIDYINTKKITVKTIDEVIDGDYTEPVKYGNFKVQGLFNLYPDGTATTTCSSSIAGTIMYSTGTTAFYGCDGTSWELLTN